LLPSYATIKEHHADLGLLANGTVGLWDEHKGYAVRGAHTPDSDSYSFSAFAVEETDWGDLHLEAGLRYDYNRTVPAKNEPHSSIGNIRSRTFQALASSVSAIYNIGQNYYLGGTLMHSFRPPSQEELYSEGPHVASYSYEIGNPDLDPERGLGKELFLRYRGGSISAELTGYHNSFSNYIYPQNTGETNDNFPSLNNYQFRGADSRIYGAEASAEIELISGLAFDGTFSYTYGERDLTAKEQKLDPEAAATRPLPMIPPFKASAGLTYAYERFRLVGRTR